MKRNDLVFRIRIFITIILFLIQEKKNCKEEKVKKKLKTKKFLRKKGKKKYKKKETLQKIK